MNRQRSLFSRTRGWNATAMLASASVVLASLPGCAFIFSQGPPPTERQAKDTYFDCSDSWVPSIVDALLATGVGITAASSYSNDRLVNAHGVAAVAATTSALFATSAIYGVTSVASCGRAKAARLARKQRENLLPPPYGMPPWGEPPPSWPPPVAFYRPPAPLVAPKPAPAPVVTPAPIETPVAPPVPAPTPPARPVFRPAPPAAPPGP